MHGERCFSCGTVVLVKSEGKLGQSQHVEDPDADRTLVIKLLRNRCTMSRRQHFIEPGRLTLIAVPIAIGSWRISSRSLSGGGATI